MYLEKLLLESRRFEPKSVITPLEVKVPTDELVAVGNPENKNYPCRKCRNIIGSLIYDMLCTLPDLCHTVSLLSQYQSKPSGRLWILIKRVLRYVKGTLDLKLTFTKFKIIFRSIPYLVMLMRALQQMIHSTLYFWHFKNTLIIPFSGALIDSQWSPSAP